MRTSTHPPMLDTSCKNVVIKFARQMLHRDRRGPHPRPNSIYHLLHVRYLLYDSLKAKLIFARIIIQVQRVQAIDTRVPRAHDPPVRWTQRRRTIRWEGGRSQVNLFLVYLPHVARQLFTVSQAAMKFYKLPTGGGQGKKSSWRRWWCWPPINNTALEMREFIDLIVKDINWRFNIVIT